jgi:hypothetical protein
MSRTIQYAFHREDGSVISRVGDEVAWPVLDYEAIGRNGDFRGPLKYDLERHPLHRVGREWAVLVWTKHIPIEIKNAHRAFWGMQPLPNEPPIRSVEELCSRHRTRFYFTRSYAIGDRALLANTIGIYHSIYGERERTGLFHWFAKKGRRYVFVEITSKFDHEYDNFKEVKHDLRKGAKV